MTHLIASLVLLAAAICTAVWLFFGLPDYGGAVPLAIIAVVWLAGWLLAKKKGKANG